MGTYWRTRESAYGDDGSDFAGSGAGIQDEEMTAYLALINIGFMRVGRSRLKGNRCTRDRRHFSSSIVTVLFSI